MFTRSQSRAIANPSDSGSASQPSKVDKKKPAYKFMGIMLRGKANQNKYKTHDQRDIRTTKWACPTTILFLGITNEFDLLCNNVGIRHFVFQDVQIGRASCRERVCLYV